MKSNIFLFLLPVNSNKAASFFEKNSQKVLIFIFDCVIIHTSFLLQMLS